MTDLIEQKKNAVRTGVDESIDLPDRMVYPAMLPRRSSPASERPGPVDRVHVQRRFSVTVLLRERAFWVLLCAGALLYACQTFRMASCLTAWEHRQIRNGWLHCADIVLAGDSRILEGVCPAPLADRLGARVLNSARTAVRYTPDYCRRIEQILDPHSRRRVVVLGITPVNFFEQPFDAEEDSTADTGRLGPWLAGRLDSLTAWLSPWRSPTRIYYPDGWVTRRVHSRTLREVQRYRTFFFPRNRLDPGALEAFFEQVDRWHRQGIVVVAFRPPSTPQLVALEDSESHLDYARFADRFRAAGGLWLDVPPYQWQTYDGVHLHESGARAFSRYLADRLAEVLVSAPAVTPWAPRNDPAHICGAAP